jgi:hypothetical protein
MRRKAKAKKNSSGWPVVDPSTEEIPSFLSNAISYLQRFLDTEGLFRISALQSDVEKLTKMWKKGKVVLLGDEHTVAGSLKLFFREFDDPLLTYELYDAFIEAARQKLEEKKFAFVAQAIGLLPPYNRALLKTLLEMLHLVSTRSSANKMSPANLAIVFAPSIIRAENESQMAAMMSMRATTDLVEYLIVQGAKLFAPAKAVASAPEEEPFTRELRRGTIRLGTRLMINKLERLEEDEDAPEVPDLPEELVADVLQEQAKASLADKPPTPPSASFGGEKKVAAPQQAPAPVVTIITGSLEKERKMPAGAVKMMIGRAPPPQLPLPPDPEEPEVALAKNSQKSVSIKTPAAGCFSLVIAFLLKMLFLHSCCCCCFCCFSQELFD